MLTLMPLSMPTPGGKISIDITDFIIKNCNVSIIPLHDSFKANEPWHDKTNKMSVRPAKTQISLGIRPVWSVFAVRMKKAWVLSYPVSAQRRLWSDWADAQADPSLQWAHTHLVGFAMSWLMYNNDPKYLEGQVMANSVDADLIAPEGAV